MKNLILMAMNKANRLSDQELAEQIAVLEAGKKLFLPDDDGHMVPLHPLILDTFRHELETRNKSKTP